MNRAAVLRIAAATVVAVTMLVLASVVTAPGPQRAHPPRDEVRIVKILDFQLPEV